jgi:hypothetical protein
LRGVGERTLFEKGEEFDEHIVRNKEKGVRNIGNKKDRI